MPNITPNNHLFFYQLFSTEMGTGKQTPVARVEEVLAEADVLLDDIDCESVDQMLEALADFMKLTVFKKGRVFVTVMARPDLDELLEKAAEPVVDKDAAAAGRSWKRARRSKEVRPVKPRHKRKRVTRAPEVAPEELVSDAVAETEVQAVEARVAPAAADAGQAELAQAPAVAEPSPEAPLATAVETVADTAEAEEAPTAATIEAKPEHGTASGEPAASEEAPAEEPTASAAAAESAEPSISFNITYVPEPEEDEPEDEEVPTVDEYEQAEPEPLPAPRRSPNRKPLAATHLPKRFSEEVFLPDELMLKIYRALPPTVGILDTLDESWEFAQEMGSLEGSRTRLTFPLSRRIEGGLPAEVTICRATMSTSPKRWRLEAVYSEHEEA